MFSVIQVYLGLERFLMTRRGVCYQFMGPGIMCGYQESQLSVMGEGVCVQVLAKILGSRHESSIVRSLAAYDSGPPTVSPFPGGSAWTTAVSDKP